MNEESVFIKLFM